MTAFFQQDLSQDSTDLDYKGIRDQPQLVEVRAFIEDLWRKFRPLADPHFPQEAQISFHLRFWEMYLAVALRDKGWDIQPFGKAIKSGRKGPDICIIQEARHIWIEAIAPTSGFAASDDAVPELQSGQVAKTLLAHDKIALRYLAAIKEKHRKYKSYLSAGVIAPQDSYIIAINSHGICNFSDDPGTGFPRVLSIVFPLGNLYSKWDLANDEITETGFSYKGKVTKASGKDIDKDIFLRQDYEGVSAILSSCINAANRRSAACDDFVLVHNPQGTNKIPLGYFQFGREYWTENTNDSNTLKSSDHRSPVSITERPHAN
jgi:hypothetical protein